MTLGERIKASRVKAGLSRADLGKKLAVSRQVIDCWERDEYKPHSLRLAQVVKLLGMRVSKRAA